MINIFARDFPEVYEGFPPTIRLTLIYLTWVAISVLLFVEFGAWGCADYARFLMHKYGTMKSIEKRRDGVAPSFKPYPLKYEKKYKTTKKRKKFLFFLWLSRILFVLFYMWCIIGIGLIVLGLALNSEITDYYSDIMFLLMIAMVAIPNVLAVVCLLPFDFLSHLFMNGRWGQGGDGWID